MTDRRTITLTVNGERHTRAVETRWTLGDFLRRELKLTGTHLACEHGVCGACTIHLNGEAVRSCILFAVQADGCAITTVEGLSPPDGPLHIVQEAFRDHHGLQCGYCTPGMLMTVTAFLKDSPAPSEAEVREALSGNLCRCTGYQGIVKATLDAARRLRESV